MASMAKGMAEKGRSGWLLLPGALLVLVGLAVILWPAILPWLLGGTSIVLGLMGLRMALWVHGLLARLEAGTGEQAAPPPEGSAS